jgi:hypothetical protein
MATTITSLGQHDPEAATTIEILNEVENEQQTHLCKQ